MKKSVFLFSAISFIAFNAYAAQTEITIYNQNLALIKKSQTIEAKAGANDIVFDEVAQQLKPESAYIFGEGIRVLEQNYDYAGISYETMLKASVGQEVKTVRQNPSTGANIFEKAILVAADSGRPVLKFDYGIETAYPGRVLFDKIPPELNSTPVLMAKIETLTAGAKNLNLAYLTSGFEWEANYVAKVNDDEHLSLIGRAAISNNSGSGYDNVKVNLIAGDVNVVRNVMQPRALGRSLMVKSMGVANFAESSAMIDEPISMDSYYVYKIPETTSLNNGQMKQISFVSAPEVKYTKEGVINSSLYFSEAKNFYKDVHPQVYYHFMNDKTDGLGMPLPQGTVSFYAYDDAKALQFIGENRIDNKAEGQKISLQLGQFFDVYGEGKIVEVKKTNSREYRKTPKDDCLTFEQTYQYVTQYKITNKSNKTVHMVLKQPLHNAARLVSETLKGQAGEGNVYEWHFDLVAGAEQVIDAVFENERESKKCGEISLQ